MCLTYNLFKLNTRKKINNAFPTKNKNMVVYLFFFLSSVHVLLQIIILVTLTR